MTVQSHPGGAQPNRASAPVYNVHVRSIALDLVLTLFTFGLFNLYVQYCQMIAVNEMLKARKYSFILWLILVIITFGLYHIYHEYRKTADIMLMLKRPDALEPIISIVLTMCGLWVVADAVQQAWINKYFGSDAL